MLNGPEPCKQASAVKGKNEEKKKKKACERFRMMPEVTRKRPQKTGLKPDKTCQQTNN